jgi:hypothetical protein
VLIPLFKGKGDRLQPNSYRGISLLSLPGKVYVHILHQRIRAHLDSQLLEAQHGFREGRGTGGALFSMRRLAELARDYGKPLHAAFVDLRAAFDSVNRDVLWQLLLARGVAPKLVQLIQDLYQGCKASVRTGGQTSAPFPVHTGVRQGCPMSPTLFNVYIDFVTRLVAQQCQEQGVHGYSFAYTLHGQLNLVPATADLVTAILMLLYADDLVLLCDDSARLHTALRLFESTAATWGLQLNHAKTKFMVFGGEGPAAAPAPAAEGAGPAGQPADSIVLAHGQVQRVQEFSYLGSLLHSTGGQQPDISSRLTAAGHVFRRLRSVLTSRHISLGTRVRIYKAIVVPTLLYGAAESWAPTQAQQQQLDVFKTTRLRIMTRDPCFDETAIRNEDLYQKTQQIAISSLLRKHRLRWLGHLARMHDSRQPKQLLFATAPALAPGTTLHQPRRISGGQALTWPKLAEQDLEQMYAGYNWVQACQDRPKWRQMAAAAI